MPASAVERVVDPAITRLTALAPANDEALAALRGALQRARSYRARRELMVEGHEVVEPLILLGGWAARIRLLEDGRRQILNFLLPGDVIGLCGQDRPLAASTVIAITSLEVCPAPSPALTPALTPIYAASRAIEDAYLLAQIVRLGRLNAYERIADLLLELLERLELAGLAVAGKFEVPLTQEMLADALGLTSVHVNRTVQTLRRDGLVSWRGRELALTNPAALRRQAGRPAVRVSASG